MWQANEAQRARVLALAEGFAEEIPACGDVMESRDWLEFFTDLNTYREPCRRLAERLERRFGEDFLCQAMAEFLAFPEEHGLPKDLQEGSEQQRRIAQIAQSVARAWLISHGDRYAVSLIIGRLRHLVSHLEEDPEGLRNAPWRGACYLLDVRGCISLLEKFDTRHPEVSDVFEQLMLGHWDGPVTLPESEGLPPRETTRYAVLGDQLLPGLSNTITILDRLCSEGQLDYDGFLALYRRFPRLIPLFLFRYGPRQAATPGYGRTYGAALCGYVQRLVRETVQTWDPAEIEQLGRLGGLSASAGIKLHDGQWLLEACGRVEQWDLATIDTKDYWALSGIQGLAADEDPDGIVESLRGFSEQTLLLMLPLVEGGQARLLRALGWEDLGPVLVWLQHGGDWHYRLPEQSSVGLQVDAIDNDNIVNRDGLVALLAQANIERVGKLVAILHATKWERNSLIYLEAVLGWNLKAQETSMKRGKHAAIAAYGLRPLERGEAEVLERYLRLKKIAKDSVKYGSGRQASTRAIVQAGLTHLAQTAGYADLARLEWDMEAKIGGDGAPLDRRETIGDWEVELSLDGLEPQIQIFKQGKPLKSVSAGLRKLERFLAFKDAQANIKAQVGRFRLALEAMMVGGDTLTPDDLNNMARLPVMSRLLQRLILRGEAGRFGFFHPEGPSLDGLDGTKTALDSTMLIAHPYHFFQDGVLPAWQQAVVKRRIVQPFKQVFRELYILTPAEEETAVYSNRFVGHALKSPIASRLLQTRGWRISGDEDHVEVCKAFGKAGLSAEFDFPDAYRHLTFMAEVVSDQIRFVAKDKQPVALKDVPPLVFSEVMRDADLVVSVAQLDEQDRHWSTESYQRRAELITALLGDLGLKGVRCEGHFAHVTGKRANYRVHLGSAAIHIEPGNYLCIVPNRSDKRDSFFLPFADAEPKTSEIISKILLLANDSKIKDPGILAQIEAAGRR